MKRLMVGVATAAIVMAMGLPIAPIIDDVGAKGFRVSRSISRASPTKAFSNFSAKKTTARKAPRTRTAQTGFKSDKSQGKKSRTIKSGRQATGLGKTGSVRTKKMLVAKQERQKFKQQPKRPINTKTGKPVSNLQHRRNTRKQYTNNTTYSSASRFDRSTYYDRRSRLYGDWDTPSVVYNMRPSYGLYDTRWMTYSLYSPYGSSWFYHNQNNLEVQRYRRELEQQARSDAKLQAQLDKMEVQMAAMAGTTIDANYMPEGVDADLMLSEEALASQVPEFKLCVGSKAGAYFTVAAGIIAPKTGDLVSIIPVTTAGTGQALELLANGKCDGAIAQGDGYWNFMERTQTATPPFEKVGSLFTEAVQLMCNESGESKISKLDDDNKVYFPQGSGAAETWSNFVAEDSDYGDVKTILNTPAMAINGNQEGLLKVMSDKNACMMYVGAAGATEFMKLAENVALQRKVVLIDINDGSLDDTTNPVGETVYTSRQIDSSVYPNLTRQAGSMYGSGDIDSLYMEADFLVNNAWKAKHPKVYTELALRVLALQPQIDSVLGQ